MFVLANKLENQLYLSERGIKNKKISQTKYLAIAKEIP
jgi:hypothetical protein